LNGVLFAALASITLLLIRASRPHVAFLGRIPGTNSYSDLARRPENEALSGIIAFRPEASLLYINADTVLAMVMGHVRAFPASAIRLVICDLSASAYIDLAGSQMLHEMHGELASQGISLRIVGARGRVRDLLRADGVGDKVGGIDRALTLDTLLGIQTSEVDSSSARRDKESVG
jgi:MFS superfamily sulfate permease-like transporter